MTDNFEILAPAGNMDNLIAAVYAGANSVYLGVQSFNARASAANFSFEELKQAVSFCRARDVKVNVTLNTLIYDTELADFKETVKSIAQCGVDAIITQDIAAAKIIKSMAPTIAIHGSTQMAVHTLEGAILLKQMGYSRVILARELSLEQVIHITKNCGIETEVFVHGALCVCLSGQCYASAFLGGRSGNRGRCAGTCRLPMSARGDLDDSHLSLKDLSALDMLPLLKQAGVKCVKIEGRLRTPEYVAGAVDACKKAVLQQEYDRQILADTFSRSGFTNAFLSGKMDGNAFGVRTKEDSAKTKQTLPKLREIYRREGQYIPISFSFEMGQDVSLLTISDKNLSLSQKIQTPLQDSNGDFSKSITASLEKLGGTPFYCVDIKLNLIEGKYLPLSLINSARRELTEKLLEHRSKITPHIFNDIDIPLPPARNVQPKIMARFEQPKQIPMELEDKLKFIVLPIEYYRDIPQQIVEKTILELPRDMFNGTDKLKLDIEEAMNSGFNKFYLQNIGHIPLVKGETLFGGFTLNVSNSVAAVEYKNLGVEYITVSPEITLEQIKRFTPQVKTITVAYGHIPLMLTKACPLQNVRDCSQCEGEGFLVDRKGMQLPVICHGKIKGYREIFNPIPIYMGERIKEIQSDFISLNFTIESAKRTKEVIEMFLQAKPFDGDFTRGLYYKASI